MAGGPAVPLRMVMRALGVRTVSDIHERLCDLGIRPPLDAKRRAWLEAIRAAGILFVHIPKTGGMSVNTALYGQHVTHCSIRYYVRVAPDLTLALPSVAVVRDPVDRFLSAYRYARTGGTAANRVSAAFRACYAAFRSPDDALDHVERARTPYQVDHIFRPQSWFVQDRAGRIAVDTLIPYEQIGRIAEWLPAFPACDLPHINQSAGTSPPLSLAQLERLRILYAADFALADIAAARSVG